ncbi:MAG: hypothetical protein QG608_717 [Actinomycetota bacterium]|nr:hypothetical protein [Actinomycetota bacterium]
MTAIDPTTLTPAELSSLLRAWTGGLYPGEAAIGLLVAHGHWLRRRDFLSHLVDAVDDGWGPRGSVVPMASIEWSAVADFAGRVPASTSELTILRLAASLAGAATPLSVMELTGGLDETNARHVLDALAHRFGWHEHGITHLVTGRQVEASHGAASSDADLPSFEQLRAEADRVLGDAANWLRSDYRPGTGPCGDAAAAVRTAFAAIGTAKNALSDAAYEQSRVHAGRHTLAVPDTEAGARHG